MAFSPVARSLCVLALTLLLAGCEGALFAGLNSTTPHDDTVVRRGLVFDEAHRLALDVYIPKDAAGAPVVVFFYGGSWVDGKRAWYRFVGAVLARHGVIAVIPDYRKFPAVQLDGFMGDAARAVAWTHAHAAEWGGNPREIFVMGHSAGGQIAALLATDPRWLGAENLRTRDLAGVIGLAGVYQFVPIADDDDEMLRVFGSDPAVERRGEPIAFVDGTEPPMLLLQGTGDDEVEPSNSIAFADALRARGDQVTLKLYPDVGHSSLLLAMSQPMRSEAPTLSDVEAFILRHSRAAP